MKTIMFLRHGHVMRPKGRYVSEYQLFLSELGQQQANSARAFVEDFAPEIILSSPIPRAKETAERVNVGLNLEIIEDADLRERAFTPLFDMEATDIVEKHGKGFWERLKLGSEYVEMEGEETMRESAQRVLDTIQKYLKSLPQEKILIVSHGGPHSWWCCNLFKMPLSKLRLFSLGEGCYSKFSFDRLNLTKVWQLNSSKI